MAIERLAAAVPDRHVAVSERTRRDLRSLGVGNARLVPNGIDMSAVEDAPPAGRDLDVLFVGRLIEEKNAALLVRSLAELLTTNPDVQCVLVGEGPERDRIERLVDRFSLGDNVSLLGFRDSHDEILGLMKAAEVFVLPSRREGFGMTALEALACGTPVVTIAHPQNAAADLVVDGVTGAVCEARPPALADAFRRARGLSSTTCVDTANRYDWDEIVDRVETVYQEIESEPPDGPPSADDPGPVEVP